MELAGAIGIWGDGWAAREFKSEIGRLEARE